MFKFKNKNSRGEKFYDYWNILLYLFDNWILYNLVWMITKNTNL